MLPDLNLPYEETSSAENMQTHEPAVKRKRNGKSCHQCHKNDKEIVVGCTKCTYKYCSICITKWYTTLDMADVVEACPVCRNICNCAACLKPKHLPIPDVELGTEQKIKHSHDIVSVLLPYLKQFVAEEYMEIEHEARIQGLPVTGLHLVQSNFINNDNFCCNHCRSSMLDVHRACDSCVFKLCVTCCLEIRGSIWSESSQYRVQHDGTLVCPPESLGGCGRRNLELMSRYPTNWISELLNKAEIVASVGKVIDSSGVVGFVSSQGSVMENKTLLDVARNDLKHFQFHLRRGEPVIVPDTVSEATELSLEPLVMWRACRKHRNPDQEIKDFRVEDWPPAESLKERLPRHFLEFVRCLPFMLYTHPHAGHLNMSAKTPVIAQKLDMGPKMSINYGVGEELETSSLTMVHYAPSDRVDILMHTAATSSSKVGHTEPEGGAIWDVFKRRDVPKLEEYLRKHAGKLKPISRLHQKLGDAVFVPAGCPHQIRYLQSCTSVAFNFVAPESVGECIRLSSEYRRLPQNHRYKEDKLQVKQMTLHAVSQAVEYLETVTHNGASSSRRQERVHSEIREVQIPLGTLMYMKQDMEAKLLKLAEKQVQPHLQQSIQNLLVAIAQKIQKNVVG